MYILIKAFCFLLILNSYEAEEAEEAEESEEVYFEPGGAFTFSAMSLCHSGLLVTWKLSPNDTILSYDDEVLLIKFNFTVHLVEEKQNTSILVSQQQITHLSFEGQHKIHSLNESTLYEVFISQQIEINDQDDGTFEKQPKTDSVRIKTNSKCKGRPAKPDFAFIPGASIPTCGVIKWYPCGRESNCHNQESGTHFGIIIEIPYNTMKLNKLQVNKEEFYADYVAISIKPGEIYEVVVYSVNDEEITYSDLQEIFEKPKFSQVRYVKVISLPDLSVLLSWEPPKYTRNNTLSLNTYYADCLNVSNSKGDQILLPKDFLPSDMLATDKIVQTTQRRIFNIKPEVTYNCIIFLCGSFGVGYEYRLEYKLKIYDDEFQIAKPDFNYELGLFDGECWFNFQWLPCGQSFDCKNTRPGSNYTFQLHPEPIRRYDLEKVGLRGQFDMNMEYNVTVKSSIANTSSESAPKLFKNCAEIRRNIP